MASGRAMTGILGYSIQYLEIPNGIWKDHDRQIGVLVEVLKYFFS